MAFRVVLTDRAEADVESVLNWFREQRATDAGGRWFAQLREKLQTLEQYPQRCPLAAESEDVSLEVRELLLGRKRFKHRILFTVIGQTVTILRVWHSSRDAIIRSDLD
jgi:plasmid stabilization system protein ParE